MTGLAMFARVFCDRSLQFVGRDHGESSAARSAIGNQRATFGCADDGERGGGGATISAMRGAIARAAICAEAQIGAPAQATTCRRGSPVRTIKPICSAMA